MQKRPDTKIPKMYTRVSVLGGGGKELRHLGFNSFFHIWRLDHKTFFFWVKKSKSFSSPISHVSGYGKNINQRASHKGAVKNEISHHHEAMHGVPQSKCILFSCLHAKE